MPHHRLYVILLGLLMASPTAGRAQSWTKILSASRATDWSHAGIPGGIPNRTKVCRTVSPSGRPGSADVTKIERAIESCAGKNEVVQLEPGNYTLSRGLAFRGISGVTLRGAGPDKTKLTFHGTVGCGQWAYICVSGHPGWARNYKGSTTWIAGYTQGTSVITLGSTRGLKVGQVVILDQRNDSIGICPPHGRFGACSGRTGATENGTTITIATSLPHHFRIGQCVGVGGIRIAGYKGWFRVASVPSPTTFQYNQTCQGRPVSAGLPPAGGGSATADTAGVYMSNVPGATTDERGGIGRWCPDLSDPACAPGEISHRDQMEIKRITVINGNQVTIDPPLEMPNWRASQSPGVWWTGRFAGRDGIEDLTIDSSFGPYRSAVGGIVFNRADECWMKNVRSIDANRNHVWLITSARIDVVDSYFFGNKGGATMSYGIEVYNGGSDNLIENNLCQHVVACLMVGGDVGSVFAYNYMFDSGYRITDWLMPMANENHDFSGMELFEGNDAPGLILDDVHGTSTADTAFRNRFRGQDTPARTNSLIAVTVSAFNRFANVVGNVLGTAGVETRYQVERTFGSGYVWSVGAQSEHYRVPNDPLTVGSLLRWGNYNVVSHAAEWKASGVPSSSYTFMGSMAVPPSKLLPPSFFLTSRPAFWQTEWGTPPWPAIGPDVTRGNAPDGAGGHSYAIPAQLCAMHTPIDPEYQKSWNVSQATWSSGKVTLTIGPNVLVRANTITVAGIQPDGYNGMFSVTFKTPETIRYALPRNPGPYVSGGTVTWPNILQFDAARCYPVAFGH